MRRQFLSIVLLPFVLGSLVLANGMARPAEQGNKDADESKLIGTWKLVSAKYGNREIDVSKLGTTLKHITPTSFVWVGYDAETKVVSRTAGGTYTLKGDQYEEIPQYGLSSDFDLIRDKPQSFKFKIEGDKWHHNGALSSGLKIEEVWERCKKE